MGPCWIRAKWSLGEMATELNEKWAKMKLGKRAGQILGGMGEGRSWQGQKKKKWPKREKNWANGNERNGIGQTGN